MHVDAREIESGSVIEGDLCIIGAGAAGLSIALEFDGSPVRVILLEGGGFEYDEQVQELYSGRTTGQPYFPLKACRLHYFGGTTGHWGGQCSPLDDVDFAERPWVPHSGWPIQRGELEPFYERAHEILDLGPYTYDVASWLSANPKLGTPLSPDGGVWSKLWRFVPPPKLKFGKKFRSRIVESKNIQLYTYANVMKLQLDEGASRIESVSVSNHAGKKHTVRARQFVLAGCSIQNARLLLASNDRLPAGLGNEHDLVGRFFMEHLELKAAELWLRRANPLKLYQYNYGETAARIEFAISAEKQREHAILNGTASLMPLSLAREIKPVIEVWGDGDPRQSLRVLTVDREKSRDRLKKASPEARLPEHQAYEVFLRLEQVPNPNSRVTLDSERDALGMPRATLHWELSRIEKHTIRTVCRLIAQQLGAADAARVRLMEYLRDEADDSWPSFTGGGWHHVGTTRMSDDPRQGVVNRDCRLHRIPNLYVAGSSCFPTSGAVNPTLSIVAMSLRLADHLRQNFR